LHCLIFKFGRIGFLLRGVQGDRERVHDMMFGDLVWSFGQDSPTMNI
jgi:hypothetical protein